MNLTGICSRSDLKVWGMMTRTRRGIADDDGSGGEVPQFKISRLNRRHISPAKPCIPVHGIAAVHLSAFGTKRTCQSCRSMSAFGGKADNILLVPILSIFDAVDGGRSAGSRCQGGCVKRSRGAVFDQFFEKFVRLKN